MSRKRLSQRRENELAALDEDLPLVKILRANPVPTMHTTATTIMDNDNEVSTNETVFNDVGSTSKTNASVSDIVDHASTDTSEISCSTFSDDSTGLEEDIPEKSLREELRTVAIEELNFKSPE